MVAFWMAYLIGVSGLLAVAAWALEYPFALRGWPTRAPWAVALGGTVLVPLGALVVSSAVADEAGPLNVGVTAQTIVVAPLEPVTILGEEVVETVAAFDRPLLVLWALASGGVLLFVGSSALRLGRRRRGWRRVRLDHRELLISRGTGPAAVGLLRSRIVVPEWVLSLDTVDRELVLLHEEEHVRARDPQLRFLAIVMAAAMPWNAPVWWLAHRIRVATEIDCDARVIARTRRRAAYSALLLDVGTRASRGFLPAPSFARPVSILEKRLLMMSIRNSRGSLVSIVRGGAVAAVAAMLALALDQPALSGQVQPDAAPRAPTLRDEPTVTPFTTPPSLVDPAEVARLLEAHYPAALKAAGRGGTVNLWTFIDEEGVVRNVRLARSSGEPELDAAAEAVMRQARFRPARNRDVVAPVWVQLPVTFLTMEDRARTGPGGPLGSNGPAPRAPDPSLGVAPGTPGAASPQTGASLQTGTTRGQTAGSVEPSRAQGPDPNDPTRSAVPASASTGDPRRASRAPAPPGAQPTRAPDPQVPTTLDEPTFTPFEVRPELRNRTRFVQEMQRLYPAMLKEAGISGTVNVWVFIDEEGVVRRTRINQSSGQEQFDQVAEFLLSEVAEFSAALNRGARVPAWISLPVTFQVM